MEFPKAESESQNAVSQFHLGSREKPLEVFEITSQVKGLLESEFPEVVLVGEVSNFKAHPSGHWYFSLKDDRASLSACMFRGANNKVKFNIENGQKIIAFGKLSVYPPRGSYQIVISRAEPEGLGSLQLAFEQLKKKLEKEGLFESDKKKEIPKFPGCIAVVTASSGAAIRDILNVLDRRFSGLQILIYPVKVQGDGAAEEISAAIDEINQFFPQVETMIVGRGGGSIEDLWAFNEEIVARSIAASSIPIISAVGHEIDFSISDFVADLRAPTPSAAAELVISNKLETIRHLDHLQQRLLKFTNQLEYLGMKVDDLSQKLQSLLYKKYTDEQMRLERLKNKLYERSPFVKLKEMRYRLETASKELERLPEVKFENINRRLEACKTKLKLLNPRSIMDRGYSLVRKEKTGQIVRKASEVEMGERVIIELSKGKLRARV